jgi:hypothetical protein
LLFGDGVAIVLIGAGRFLEALFGTGDVFITGMRGSGKTLLSFVLAHQAVKRKWVKGVWANIPHRYPPAESIESAAIIIDETAQVMDSRWSAMSYDLYSMWARKMGSIFLYPSVNAIDKRCRNLEVIRVQEISILPVKIWEYRWKTTLKQEGKFWLFNPERYFNTYDTKIKPRGDGGVLEAIVALDPEAVKEILDARSGDRLERLLGDAGVEVGHRRMTTRISVAEFRRLESRVRALEVQLGYSGSVVGVGSPETICGTEFRSE